MTAADFLLDRQRRTISELRTMTRLRNRTPPHQNTPAFTLQYPVRTMPDLPVILNSIRCQPDDKLRWLAIAA